MGRLKTILYFFLILLLVSGCAKKGEKKEVGEVKEKGVAEEEIVKEPFEVIKEVSLAMLSGDAEKVLSMTTKKFQDSLLSENKKMLEEAKNNKEMQEVLGEQFGKEFEELIELTDEELLTVIIERIKAPEEELEKMKQEAEKATLLDKKIEGNVCTLKMKDAEGKEDTAILKLEEGNWLLDEIGQFTRKGGSYDY